MLSPRILSVEAVEPYKIVLEYDGGEKRLFDVGPYISGQWFGLLADKSYFNSVHLLPDGFGIEWRGGRDIAPHELYELSEKIN